MELGLVAVLLP